MLPQPVFLHDDILPFPVFTECVVYETRIQHGYSHGKRAIHLCVLFDNKPREYYCF